ncbi:hypothetical protein TRVA0_010S02124 [Trichomonascus vanleenenianus]|uniref:Elg1p n=1 Tax=Trichomonascus vanleenenianus TaxID=2268995 RepID=UPI003ECB6C46
MSGNGSSRTLFESWGLPDAKRECLVTLKLPQKALRRLEAGEPIEIDREEPIAPHPFFEKRVKPVDHGDKTGMDESKMASDNKEPEIHPFFRARRSSSAFTTGDKPAEKPQEEVHPFFQTRKRAKKVDSSVSIADNTKSEQATTAEKLSDQPKISVKVTLKLPKEVLEQFKPKVHPFFKARERRPRSAPTVFSHEAYNQPLVPAPWPKYSHVRGDDCIDLERNSASNETQLHKSAKNKQRKVPMTIDDAENMLNHILDKKTTTHFKPATRLFVSGDELRQIALNCISGQNMRYLEPLLATVGDFKAFDKYECETSAWTNKYAPRATSLVASADPRAAPYIVDWLRYRIGVLKHKTPQSSKKQQRKKRKSNLDGFIVDEDNDQGEADLINRHFLILHGPPGSGKTSAVYAAGKELSAYVFEVNASMKRSSKDLLELLDGMGQSHLVHQIDSIANPESVVLFEEADVLFEDEKSFWMGLTRFADLSKRPIVLTCSDLSVIPQNIIEMSELLEFKHSDASLQVDILLLIALNEGHLVPRKDLQALVRRRKNDLRACINDLQFSCQMGLGGRKSGVDWLVTKKERQQYGSKRVVSRCDTPIIDYTPSGPGLLREDNTFEDAESRSVADLLHSLQHSALLEDVTIKVPDKMAIAYTEERDITTKPLPFELKPYEFIHPNRVNIPDDNPALNKSAVANSLRDAMAFLSYPPYPMVGTYNSIDCLHGATLATDVAPYVRFMASVDLIKKRQLETSISSLNEQGNRTTKRSLTAQGVPYDSTHLECDNDDLREIIATGFVGS